MEIRERAAAVRAEAEALHRQLRREAEASDSGARLEALAERYGGIMLILEHLKDAESEAVPDVTREELLRKAQDLLATLR